MEFDIIKEVSNKALKVYQCGSRVTCNPPPMDTDADYLVLVKDIDSFSELCDFLLKNDFYQGGSCIADEANTLLEHERFTSFSNAVKINFIITLSNIFYDRFVLATNVCKSINEMRKPCRITIFQAILYGKFMENQSPLEAVDIPKSYQVPSFLII